MNFRDVLSTIVDKVDGCHAGLIMGFDGVSVEEFVSQAGVLDLQTLGVEYCTALGEVRRTAESLQAGAVEEVTVQTESAVVIMRPINPEYFLAIVLTKDGNFGKGRYYLRRVAVQLQPEF